jgi:alpha-D-xyloside xylohydrolase
MYNYITLKSYNKIKTVYFLLLLQFIISISSAQIGNLATFTDSGKSILLMSENEEKIRITPYGESIVRIQTVRKNEDFYPDDHYEMVASHDWNGKLIVDSNSSSLTLSTNTTDGIKIIVTKSPLRLSFSLKSNNETLLSEKDGTVWNNNTVTESFISTTDEHFAGLGHEAYGRIAKLDRQGSSLKVSRGNEGACVVPFYVSSKGYGVFLK